VGLTGAARFNTELIAPSSPRCISCLEPAYSGQNPHNLFLEHFFDLPDLFLDFPGVFFGVAFGL
jgi:hypothetical protein